MGKKSKNGRKYTIYFSTHYTLHIAAQQRTMNLKEQKNGIMLQFVLLYALAQMKVQIIPQHFPYLGKNVNFKNNRVFIYFPKDGPIRIVGNPQKIWLLSFQIEKSVIFSFKKNTKKGWFDDITRHSSIASNRINGNVVFQSKSTKKRKRNTYSSCETITLGYIDLK